MGAGFTVGVGMVGVVTLGVLTLGVATEGVFTLTIPRLYAL